MKRSVQALLKQKTKESRLISRFPLLKGDKRRKRWLKSSLKTTRLYKQARRFRKKTRTKISTSGKPHI